MIAQPNKNHLDFSQKQWENISKEAKDFIRQLLTIKTDKRPVAQQCLELDWFGKFK